MQNKIAILVENDFHDIEFWYPYYRLQEAGFEPLIVAPVAPMLYKGKYGTTIEATYDPERLKGKMLRGIIIPGGWAPDRLRLSKEVLELVNQVYDSGGIIAGICHAGSVLVSAKIVKGKNVTSYPSIKDDLQNAGAQWADEPVISCQRIITSRKPSDLPYFMVEVINALSS
ncbi:MAG: type 1 glutamine amidotransferase [Thermovirga sp.]|nr:type 1 glutamine amidotransferase [Thermovirga sp.]